jgi:N-dimethylarginine dimethylaminohydrolase
MKVLLQQTRVNQKLLLYEESQIHLQMPWQWRNLLPPSIWNVQESSMLHMCKFSEEVIEIPADNQYPDCPFIEDTAIVIGNQALITRPGAVSRQGEEVEVHHALAKMGLKISEVQPPGLIDGGDVLYASGLLFAGKSRRTNDDGILALTNAFPEIGVHPIKVAKRLHLKSGMNIEQSLLQFHSLTFNCLS